MIVTQYNNWGRETYDLRILCENAHHSLIRSRVIDSFGRKRDDGDANTQTLGGFGSGIIYRDRILEFMALAFRSVGHPYAAVDGQRGPKA